MSLLSSNSKGGGGGEENIISAPSRLKFSKICFRNQINALYYEKKEKEIKLDNF